MTPNHPVSVGHLRLLTNNGVGTDDNKGGLSIRHEGIYPDDVNVIAVVGVGYTRVLVRGLRLDVYTDAQLEYKRHRGPVCCQSWSKSLRWERQWTTCNPVT